VRLDPPKIQSTKKTTKKNQKTKKKKMLSVIRGKGRIVSTTSAVVAGRRWLCAAGKKPSGMSEEDKPVDTTVIPKPHTGTSPKFADWELRQARALDSHFLIEKFSRQKFVALGAALTALAAGGAAAAGSPTAAIVASPFILGYWYVGMKDMRQTRHAVLSNFPVLGHIRYLMEGIRPEIRQYFFESDTDGKPYSRMDRTLAYARSKHIEASQAFGSRFNVNECGYEWIRHSMYPTTLSEDDARITLGGRDCKKPYRASLLNISAMSYGALSGNAILALNAGAKRGGFLHNTGEGGVSRFHRAPGGDLTWNIGSGYFGCRADDGTFDPAKFVETIESTPQIRMVEIKLSQGAKPGKGGVLPGAKVTAAIAEARHVPIGQDCISPARHSAFADADGLAMFIRQLRELSGGLPISVKLCVGKPEEIADMIQAFMAADVFPDVITVDGGEGGTGAAPSEFSNSIGTPLAEGLTTVDNLLRGSGTRDRLKIIAAGKLLTSMSIIRTLATGADTVNVARGCVYFFFSFDFFFF
jgi:glutamate synthase domain-containing protein 2